MLSFSMFLLEREVDPVALAQRAAKRFGKRRSYGKWLKTEKGQHIPLSSYDRQKSDAVENKYFRVRTKVKPEQKTMAIKDLRATQPFVRTGDVDKLKAKVADKSPSHIHVAQHQGKHYVLDGHHSVMAAKLRGEKHVNVTHVNLDQH